MKEIKDSFKRVVPRLAGGLRVCLRSQPFIRKRYALPLGKVGCGGVWQLSIFKTEIYPLVGRVGSVIEREQQISWHVAAQDNWVSDKIRVF